MDQLERPEVRWGLGCLLSGIAFTGVLIIVVLVAILLQPPAWVQIAVGLGIVAGAAIFSWILANALGRSAGRRTRSDAEPRRDIKAADERDER